MAAPMAQAASEAADAIQRIGPGFAPDLRMVLAVAGDREMNAREQLIMDRLQQERGEGMYADLLYALTRKTFPGRQAKALWTEIGQHRVELHRLLERDPGVVVAAHDYLSNVTGLLRGAGMIEESKFQALATVATKDGLTGLYDKTTFTRLLQDELNRQARHQRVCSLVLADIDFFKKLNDTHGHADGDLVLQQVAEVFMEIARISDTVGRFGGEEFGVILPETDLAAAGVLAERLRAAVEAHFKETVYTVTMSFGVACKGAEMVAEGAPVVVAEADELIRRADAALYAAKDAGRNRVCLDEGATKSA